MMRTRRIGCSLAVAATLAACGTTTVDERPTTTADLSDAELTGGEGRELAEDDTSPLEPGVIVDPDAPGTTLPIAGSAADLLPEIGIEMSRLSAEIGGEGDEDATIARIEACGRRSSTRSRHLTPNWSGIQASIEMARTGVDANRPADGDKAFSILNDLVDTFTGDS